MIIDIHAHLALSTIYPPAFITGMLADITPPLQGETIDMNAAQILRFSKVVLNDLTGSHLISQMDKAGISKTVLLIVDGGLALGEAAITLSEIFECHHKVLKNFPDRIVVFGGVDPRRGEAGFELFKKGVLDYGFKGLKLYPPMGYSMDDQRLQPYYNVCSAYNLPVLIHTGPSHYFLQNELADPKHIFETAKRFKQVRFILAHAGYSLQSTSVQLAASLPNIYLDIAGFYKKIKIAGTPSKLVLGRIFDKSVNHKILFGTDWPLFNIVAPIKKQVDHIYEFYDTVKTKYSKEALDNIMYRNALTVLNATA